MVMVLFTIELLLLSVIVRSLAKGFRAYYRILVCVCVFVCVCVHVLACACVCFSVSAGFAYVGCN